MFEGLTTKTLDEAQEFLSEGTGILNDLFGSRRSFGILPRSSHQNSANLDIDESNVGRALEQILGMLRYDLCLYENDQVTHIVQKNFAKINQMNPDIGDALKQFQDLAEQLEVKIRAMFIEDELNIDLNSDTSSMSQADQDQFALTHLKLDIAKDTARYFSQRLQDFEQNAFAAFLYDIEIDETEIKSELPDFKRFIDRTKLRLNILDQFFKPNQ